MTRTLCMLQIFLGMAGLCVVSSAQAAERPNLLIILADDLGYSDVGCYGSEIRTPNLDQLASKGLRFSQFYNTARCWPTRSCLMSGYYAQQLRMDPVRSGPHPPWARLLPHYLKTLGYRCYHSGKWHIENFPRILADGGFDRSYYLRDHNASFYPRDHMEDDKPLPKVDPKSGYYHTTAITDYLLKYLKDHAQQNSQQPFLGYLAFTSPHFPLHALPEDIARYQDKYRQGWEETRAARYQRQRDMGLIQCALSDPEPTLKTPLGKDSLKILGQGEMPHAVTWASLTEEQKEFQATKMAIHAAMVDRIDREIGRVCDQLKRMNAFENTIIFFLSDNGASAEILVRGDGHDPKAAPGSATSYLCLGPGWSTSSNTPFRRHKIWVHEGGISTPLIVHWPKGIAAQGEIRHNVGHLIDIVPTLLDITGVPRDTRWNDLQPPEFPGKSLLPTFAKDLTVTHDELYFNHSQSRALRQGDWKAIASSEAPQTWALYNLAKDRAESQDLAVAEPERLKQMVARWEALDKQFRAQSEIKAATP